MKHTDILIIGGGIIGICLAIELKKALSDTQILLLEKETQLGYHASGRNSGVLHAGFYYTSDSLKAKLSREGNRLLTEYCDQNDIALNRCGKLILATNEEELRQLDVLLERGRENQVELQQIDEQQTNEIEPNAFTVDKAIYSPTTSTVNPKTVMEQLERDARRHGVEFQLNTQYLSSNKNTAKTDQGDITYHYLINAAGLYADKIAHQFGFSQNYMILPFKGLYLCSNTFKLNTNIYPVPDINQPFLGTHFTLAYDGRVKIGPTATPAFWREQYKFFERYNFTENFVTTAQLLKLWILNPFNFRSLAISELKKMHKQKMLEGAGRMLKKFNRREFTTWGKPGIRAQLINTETNELEMDYLYEGDDRSFHILNAVSPAFTSSISFSRFLKDKILSYIN